MESQSPAKTVSAWKELKRDPLFFSRLTKIDGNLSRQAIAKVAEVRSSDPVSLLNRRLQVFLAQWEAVCQALYSAAKEVWLSRDRQMTSEFSGSILEEGILPMLNNTRIWAKALMQDADGMQAFGSLDRCAGEDLLRNAGFGLYEMELRLRKMVEADEKNEARPAKRRRRDRSLAPREKIIRAAISKGFRGKTYVDYLETEGLTTPQEWQLNNDNPCRRSYVAAYDDPYWRQRINDEKSKIGAKKNPKN
jgi:hypothetical protein